MKRCLLGILLFMSLNLNAQQLQQHRWQNRLLLIVDKTADSAKSIAQLALLQQDVAALKERKLLVYQFTTKGYKKGFSDTDTWLTTTAKTAIALSKNKPFSVYLIGLDGGVKMEKHHLVKPTTIFSLIDGMPMRQAELNGY